MRLATLGLALALLAGPGAAASPQTIEDDWPRAVADAKARAAPIFVEAWAPWCHTCRFMRVQVLPEVLSARHAGRFVWLSIDTENPANAAFLERFKIEVWPTFLVLEPERQAPVARWVGSATAEQLEALLGEALRGGVARPDTELERARAEQAAGRAEEAIDGFRAALAEGGERWPRRAEAAEALVQVAAASGRARACAETARAEGPAMSRGPRFANVVGVGLSCAAGASPQAPWRAAALAALEPLAREAAALPGLLADDRSGILEALVEAREAQGDAAGARRAAARWWRFLEAERRGARSPEARAALDGPRVAAALKLGDPGRALPALEASARDLPGDYNPPARRARVLLELGRLAEARAQVEEALAKAYGPRKLGIYRLAARILEARGDREDLAALLDRAIADAVALPAPQRDDEVEAELRTRRAALEAPAAAP